MAVVTEVTVQTKDMREVHYTQQQKMRKILNYLRHIDPWDPPAKVPEDSGPETRITVCLSDGSQVIYTQLGADYLRRGTGPWMHIHAKRKPRLWLILAAVPGDKVTVAAPPANLFPQIPPEPGPAG